ncbi:MAG: metallophosphoesterase, partial [Actinomycetota bacterium]|nr:metallophosphoesterase [Actinomycetota bacterium]
SGRGRSPRVGDRLTDRRHRLAPALVAAAVGVILAGGVVVLRRDGDAPPPAPPPAGVEVLAAGDVASCETETDEKTARLLDGQPGTVLVLGDTVYDDGTAAEFRRCYAPTWGRHRHRSRPVPGNHDYGDDEGGDDRGSGYFGYFGKAAGTEGEGWYSYDLGSWHLVALNSNCRRIGGCQAGSAQERWLRADLAANTARCTLAYWHHPFVSSGRKHGGTPAMASLWRALFEHGADVVLSGHEHNYERFAPLDVEGRPASSAGMRQFVVGTGGGEKLYRFGAPKPGSEFRDDDTYGVLRLRLLDGAYEWRFLPAGDGSSDHGRGSCR